MLIVYDTIYILIFLVFLVRISSLSSQMSLQRELGFLEREKSSPKIFLAWSLKNLTSHNKVGSIGEKREERREVELMPWIDLFSLSWGVSLVPKFEG